MPCRANASRSLLTSLQDDGLICFDPESLAFVREHIDPKVTQKDFRAFTPAYASPDARGASRLVCCGDC
jgi:guanyl-specific ribonuclease Sa